MRILMTVLAVVVLAACGGNEERPTVASWRPEWEAARDLVPDAETLREEGVDVCGSFLGEVRSRREELLPSPSEVVDDVFAEWIEQAESLGLDCVDDSEDLDARLADIEDLADRIDTALGTEP